jgi:hypothetical protein
MISEAYRQLSSLFKGWGGWQESTGSAFKITSLDLLS